MRRDPIGVIAALIFLVVRGVLLWFIVPTGTVAWFFGLEWLRTKPASLGAFLGWLDYNISFVITRGPLRFAFPDSPMKWIPARDRAEVKHRIGFLDLA